MKRFTLFAIMIGTMVAVQSCKKAKLNKKTYCSQDHSAAEASFDDIYKIVGEVADDEDAVRSTYSFGSCATVTITPDLPDTTFPKTVVIDFGSGCTGNDGVTRKGRIQAVFTGRYREAGTVITIEPSNYYANDHKIVGTKVVTNEGQNSAGNTHYSIEVDGKVIDPDGNVIEWESTRDREWIEGENTTFATDGLSGIFDDVYSITGTANGVNRNGRSFVATITKSLIFQVGCRWIKEGTIELVPDELKTRTIDFGDRSEGCNNDATVTIGKKTYNIQMR